LANLAPAGRVSQLPYSGSTSGRLATIDDGSTHLFANQPMPALDERFELLVVKQLWKSRWFKV